MFQNLIKFLGVFACEIPRKAKIGKNVDFVHNALGVVINANSTIGDNTTIGAGSIVMHVLPANVVYYNKRQETIKEKTNNKE